MGYVIERNVATTTHGRCLVIPPRHPGPAPLLVGFHGYGENAEIQLERLRAIPGSTDWLLVSVQALHCFYERRTDRVVASWMTRQDRDNAIADNLAYVAKSIQAVSAEWASLPKIVFSGFSQGVGMAYRAAVNQAANLAGVIAVGGDIPPELTPAALAKIPAVLIARGVTDGWYTPPKFAEDEQRLRTSAVPLQALLFDAGHEWSPEVTAAAARFLLERHP